MAQAVERYDRRISTGIQCTIRLMLELSRWGRHDLACVLAQSTRIPSWGYSIRQGASTIWERWDAYVTGRGINESTMNSFNHYAIGAVGEWLVRDLLGINCDEHHPGYQHIIIHPRPPLPGAGEEGGPLTWVKGHYDSIRGRIAVAWKIEKGVYTLQVTIPANTKATIYVPAKDAFSVREGGQPARSARGLVFQRIEDGFACLSGDPGTYVFTSPAF